MQKIFFEILVLTALTVGLIWTILELTPKSSLLSFTLLYFHWITKEFVVGKIWLHKKVPGLILMLLLPLSIVYLIYSKIILQSYITASAVVSGLHLQGRQTLNYLHKSINFCKMVFFIKPKCDKRLFISL